MTGVQTCALPISLPHRVEPRRRRRGHVLWAVGGEALRRRLGALAQRRERVALFLVGADDLGDGVERPVLELGPLRPAAADELLDHGGERAAAAGTQRRVAALACPIVPAILQAILSLILSLILGLILPLILPLILALSLPAALSLTLGVARAPPVVEGGLAAFAVAVIAVMAAAGVGARGRAHHQHPRKPHRRLQHR